MNTYAPLEVGIPLKMARRLVSLAIRAPSVHNTQPWAWRIRPDGIDLYADESRRLEVADPTGRSLVISCGAALHHLQVAARALGLHPEVDRFTDPMDSGPLARVRFSPAPRARTAADDLRAIHQRCTDRRRFTSWPVPDGRLGLLCETAIEAGGFAAAVTDATDRFRVELLVTQAFRLLSRDPAIVAEARYWTDRNEVEGVPSAHLPEGPSEHRPSGFDDGELYDDRGGQLQGGEGLIVLHDSEDSPAAWLRCGEALSALWLRAAGEGLSVVPLSHVINVPQTRDALRHQVLGDLVTPLILVRIGWQAIGRSHLDRTPRRPLDDVLLA